MATTAVVTEVVLATRTVASQTVVFTVVEAVSIAPATVAVTGLTMAVAVVLVGTAVADLVAIAALAAAIEAVDVTAARRSAFGSS